MMKSKYFGFTLVELLVVIVIVSVLAVAAYPTYLEHVTESRRTDAYSALLELQIQLENYYAENNAYPTTLAAPLTTQSREGWYDLSIATANANQTYTLTATAVSTGPQVEDTGCTIINVTNIGIRTPDVCW